MVDEHSKGFAGPDSYIPPPSGKPEQQRFTIRSSILTGTSSWWHGASSACLLPKRTDLGSLDPQ